VDPLSAVILFGGYHPNWVRRTNICPVQREEELPCKPPHKPSPSMLFPAPSQRAFWELDMVFARFASNARFLLLYYVSPSFSPSDTCTTILPLDLPWRSSAYARVTSPKPNDRPMTGFTLPSATHCAMSV
jgi:hypothetical protein